MKIAVTPMDAAGHLNPLLALCTKLKDMGHEVKFFLKTEMNEEHLNKFGFGTHMFGKRGLSFTKEEMYEVIPPYELQDETDSKCPSILNDSPHPLSSTNVTFFVSFSLSISHLLVSLFLMTSLLSSRVDSRPLSLWLCNNRGNASEGSRRTAAVWSRFGDLRPNRRPWPHRRLLAGHPLCCHDNGKFPRAVTVFNFISICYLSSAQHSNNYKDKAN